MTDFLLGQIVPFALLFTPHGFSDCDGSSLPIQQNTALYALLGVNFGGSGQNFNLPDLRGTVPVCSDATNADYVQGQYRGGETSALTTSSLPPHTHIASAVNIPAVKPANLTGKNRAFAQTSAPLYGPINAAPTVPLNAGTLSTTGGGANHNNMQPFTVVRFCIVTSGIFPQRD